MKKIVLTALLAGTLSCVQSLRAATAPVEVRIEGKLSLAHRADGIFDPTDETKATCEAWLRALAKPDPQKMQRVLNELRKQVEGKPYCGQYGPLAWLCETMGLPESERAARLQNPADEAYYDYFTRDGAKALREYLSSRYEIQAPQPEKEASREKEASKEPATAEDLHKAAEELFFLETLLIQSYPGRDQYENPKEVLELAAIQKGQKVADIGCGTGYYLDRLAGAVGEGGMVYAVDNDDDRAEYVRDLIKRMRPGNVRPVMALKSDVSLPEPVDVALMPSSYHDLYFARTDQERRAFLASLRAKLNPGARLIIVESAPVGNDDQVPVDTLSPELIIAQLQQWRFRLERNQSLSPHRYVLIFRSKEGTVEPGDLKGPEEGLSLVGSETDPAGYTLKIDTDVSLLHFASLDSFDITAGGRQAAYDILDYIDSGMKRASALREAEVVYGSIIPKENFGGEFTALEWFCEYFLAEEPERRQMIEDPLVSAWFHYFADNNCTMLRRYLGYKYRIRIPEPKEDQQASEKGQAQPKGPITQEQVAFLEDLMLFNNPRRETWERSSKLMALLPIKEGDKVADVGSGSGYFSYRFSSVVGKEGKVFALDTNKEHIDFLARFVKQYGITNILPILSTETDICVKEKIDVAYMCSVYHIIYLLDSERDRETFVASIRNALKENGLFIIVDNGPIKPGILPYHGPHIARELVIPQLEALGFKLLKYAQIVPQRYMLIFQKTGR